MESILVKCQFRAGLRSWSLFLFLREYPGRARGDRRVSCCNDGHCDGQAFICRQHQADTAGSSPMTIAWVVGSGGLLGAALCRVLRTNGTELFFPAERFCWDNEAQIVHQITVSVQAFASQVHPTDRWEVYWAAGVGTMSSSEAALAPETRVLTLLLRLLESNPDLMNSSGTLALASSAGAIYAGSSDDLITENTPPTPTTAYACEKLKHEDLVRSVADSNGRIAVLIARISTLYGLGQCSGKQQGLLAHIARSILRRSSNTNLRSFPIRFVITSPLMMLPQRWFLYYAQRVGKHGLLQK